MKPTVLVAVLALTPLLVVACGNTKEESQAEAVQKSAEQLQKAAESAAKGADDLAAGSSSAAGSEGNSKPVDPVSFSDLIALLPAPAGWEGEKPTGRRMTSPVTFSVASVRLMKDEATVTAKITDSGFNQMFVTPFAPFLAGSYDHETDRGYEKSVKVGDAPGREKWDSPTRSGNLAVVVNKRFIVEIDGSSIDSPKVLHDVFDKTDVKKLAAIR